MLLSDLTILKCFIKGCVGCIHPRIENARISASPTPHVLKHFRKSPKTPLITSFKDFPLAGTFSSHHYQKLCGDCKYRVADKCFKDHEEEITAINRFKRFKNRLPGIP